MSQRSIEVGDLIEINNNCLEYKIGTIIYIKFVFGHTLFGSGSGYYVDIIEITTNNKIRQKRVVELNEILQFGSFFVKIHKRKNLQ